MVAFDYFFIIILVIMYQGIIAVDRSQAHNVLITANLGGSHLLFMGEVAKALQSRGFNMTVMTTSRIRSFPHDVTNAGVRWITHQSDFTDADYVENIVGLIKCEGSSICTVKESPKLMHKICKEEDQMFQDEGCMTSLIDSHFDFVILDYIGAQVLLPYILDTPFATLGLDCINWPAKVPYNPSFVPSWMTPFSDKMDFVERTLNLFVTIAQSATMSGEYVETGNFRGKPVISYNDLAARADLCFRLKAPSLEPPRPMNPNMINIGGIMGRPGQKLPEVFENIVDESANGIVLVSFGSLFDGFLDIDKLLATFGKVEETVILKWAHPIEDIPDNVKVFPWMPQNDLLASGKVKLFITHCGVSSFTEAVYHGVPMIGMPLCIDQSGTCAFMVDIGYGEMINVNAFTSQILYEALSRVLSGDHGHTIRKASKVLRSLPPARDEIAFWIEHVIKHGSRHLRPHAQDMPWYEYLMIDVLLLTICATVFCILAAIKAFKFMFKVLIIRNKVKLE